jgi:hypothetical protein
MMLIRPCLTFEAARSDELCEKKKSLGCTRKIRQKHRCRLRANPKQGVVWPLAVNQRTES